MCLFSQPVQAVGSTTIFARVVGGDPPRQILVYAMEFGASGDLAMVLPLPTPLGSAEDSVQFVSLEDYPTFFEDMAACFPQPSLSRGGPVAAQGQTNLEVHSVGAFEASFVPSVADFSRLDERFRLPEEVWTKLPGVVDYGFAVFKLKAGERQKVHPLALTFPTRNTQQIFFPTAHLHGGEFEPRARFDHTLYFQGSDSMRLPLMFDTGTFRLGRLAGQLMGVAGGAKAPRSSHTKAGEFVKVSDERGLVDPELKIYAFDLHEKLPNRDVVLWPKYHPMAGAYP